MGSAEPIEPMLTAPLPGRHGHNTIVRITNSKCLRSNNDHELDTDPDFGLAPLDDGRVICLRCTKLCKNNTEANIHYKEEHMTKKSEANISFA